MTDISSADLEVIDARAKELGREVFTSLPDERPGVFDRRWWDDHLMNWSMSDELLKVELFRFVDVLPMLVTSQAVTGHLHEYLFEVKDRLPAPMRVALGVARRTPGVRAAVAKAARLAAMDFARRFIAGSNAEVESLCTVVNCVSLASGRSSVTRHAQDQGIGPEAFLRDRNVIVSRRNNRTRWLP